MTLNKKLYRRSGGPSLKTLFTRRDQGLCPEPIIHTWVGSKSQYQVTYLLIRLFELSVWKIVTVCD